MSGSTGQKKTIAPEAPWSPLMIGMPEAAISCWAPREERMQKFLQDLLPELSAKVAHDEVPISEIEGGKVPAKA